MGEIHDEADEVDDEAEGDEVVVELRFLCLPVVQQFLHLLDCLLADS